MPSKEAVGVLWSTTAADRLDSVAPPVEYLGLFAPVEESIQLFLPLAPCDLRLCCLWLGVTDLGPARLCRVRGLGGEIEREPQIIQFQLCAQVQVELVGEWRWKEGGVGVKYKGYIWHHEMGRVCSQTYTE